MNESTSLYEYIKMELPLNIAPIDPLIFDIDSVFRAFCLAFWLF
jgi:hypothetical protein